MPRSLRLAGSLACVLALLVVVQASGDPPGRLEGRAEVTDGDTIKMELVLTTARGDTVRITRYLVRSALPAPAPVAAAVAPPG